MRELGQQVGVSGPAAARRSHSATAASAFRQTLLPPSVRFRARNDKRQAAVRRGGLNPRASPSRRACLARPDGCSFFPPRSGHRGWR